MNFNSYFIFEFFVGNEDTRNTHDDGFMSTMCSANIDDDNIYTESNNNDEDIRNREVVNEQMCDSGDDEPNIDIFYDQINDSTNSTIPFIMLI